MSDLGVNGVDGKLWPPVALTVNERYDSLFHSESTFLSERGDQTCRATFFSHLDESLC